MHHGHLSATRIWLQDARLRCQIDSLGIPAESEHAHYWRARWADPTQVSFAILAGDSDHVGNCGLTHVDVARQTAELWMYLGTEQNRGLGSAALRLLLEHAFETLGLKRIYLRVVEHNPGALRFYQRFGFRVEGIARGDTVCGTTRIDSTLLGLLESEYNRDNSNAELDAARVEVERASWHYYHTPQQVGIDNRTRRLLIERVAPHIQGPRVLELGYIDGLWTDRLLEMGFAVDIVEGASRHVSHARERYAGVNRVHVAHTLFQEFSPDSTYETILAGDMLRYLSDPENFLRTCRKWLAPRGRLIVTLPNSRSLHRRVGAVLEMQSTPAHHDTRDREVGNLRSYDRYELRHLLRSTGYSVDVLHGCFLKPLSSAQIEHWDDLLLRAFLEIGDELEDYCWFMYAVCSESG
jgi:RimJ/RimL family protein N-acetyltransferase/trans-aconitate methyltransferase